MPQAFVRGDVRETAIIGVDWGSSSVRAMRIGHDGTILDVRRANDGVLTGGGDFAARLRIHLGDWATVAPEVPLLLCGMIGSDRGWRATGYVATPADPGDLARALSPVDFDRDSRIVPGVSCSTANSAEVMRGEETLVMGFAAQTGIADARLCLPGTHSKWVRIRGGRIERFRTYLTGELRALVLENGALATGVPQTVSKEAFLDGLKLSGPALTQRLFQARARRLLGGLVAEHTASFVSGALIAEEVRAEAQEDSEIPTFLLARDALAVDYQIALSHAGIRHTLADPEPLAALGLLRIARLAGLAAG